MAAHGLLNLNKPAGMTSRQAVNRVQGVVRPARVGHAGTLDPLASGVLVVCVGAATRLVQYVQRMTKGYTATLLLGRQSPTEDAEGEVTELHNPPVPTHHQIVTATRQFVGQIDQRPPAFSAKKIAGRRAYKLARKGERVELKPQPVTVYRIDVGAYEYPELTLRVECGSGTYIRSLGRDLAELLGTAAVLSALVRTSIGGFRIEDALRPYQVRKDNWTDHLLPALRAVESLPRIELSADEVAEIGHGRMISRATSSSDAKEFAAVDAAGRLVAILTPRGKEQLGALRNLPVE